MQDDEARLATTLDELAAFVVAAVAGTAIAACLVILLGLGCVEASAAAQSDDVGDDGVEGAALLLARTCVHERNWRVSSNDCRAIAEVARWRADAQSVPLDIAIRQLSPRLHIFGEIDRPWILDLDVDAHRPRHLGSALWAYPEECAENPTARGCRPVDCVEDDPRISCDLLERRPLWLATLDEARAIIRGDIGSPCVERPSRWGSITDITRGRRRGGRWVRVDCGETVNRFGHWR